MGEYGSSDAGSSPAGGSKNKYGEYRLTVKTLVCGASNLGSIPSIHPAGDPNPRPYILIYGNKTKVCNL